MATYACVITDPVYGTSQGGGAGGGRGPPSLGGGGWGGTPHLGTFASRCDGAITGWLGHASLSSRARARVSASKHLRKPIAPTQRLSVLHVNSSTCTITDTG